MAGASGCAEQNVELSGVYLLSSISVLQPFGFSHSYNCQNFSFIIVIISIPTPTWKSFSIFLVTSPPVHRWDPPAVHDDTLFHHFDFFFSADDCWAAFAWVCRILFAVVCSVVCDVWCVRVFCCGVVLMAVLWFALLSVLILRFNQNDNNEDKHWRNGFNILYFCLHQTHTLSLVCNWSDPNPFVIFIQIKRKMKRRQFNQKNEKGRAHFHLQFMPELEKTAWRRIMNDKFLLESK